MVGPSVSIQIVLPEDDITATQSTRRLPIRHAGDELSGYVQVTAQDPFKFNIDIAFEGGFPYTKIRSDLYCSCQRC